MCREALQKPQSNQGYAYEAKKIWGGQNFKKILWMTQIFIIIWLRFMSNIAILLTIR